MNRFAVAGFALLGLALSQPLQAQLIQTQSQYHNPHKIEFKFITPEEFAQLQLIEGITKNGPRDASEIQAWLGNFKPLDARGRPISEVFYDREGQVMIGTSGKPITIVNKYKEANGDISYVISGRDKSGNPQAIDTDELSILTTNGTPRQHTFKTLEQAAPPTVLEVLVDVSGSMKGHMKGVREAVEYLMENMPPHVECGLITFGQEIKDFAENGYISCRSSDFNLKKLKADGGTPMMAALKKAYTKLGSSEHIHHQRAIIAIGDGSPSDAGLMNEVVQLRKNTTTIFFWLGNQNSGASAMFKPLATHFVAGGPDAVAKLKEYFDGYQRALKAQSVVTLKGTQP